MSNKIKVNLHGYIDTSYSIDVWIDEDSWYGENDGVEGGGYADCPNQLAEEILAVAYKECDHYTKTHPVVYEDFKINKSVRQDRWGNVFLGCSVKITPVYDKEVQDNE